MLFSWSIYDTEDLKTKIDLYINSISSTYRPVLSDFELKCKSSMYFYDNNLTTTNVVCHICHQEDIQYYRTDNLKILISPTNLCSGTIEVINTCFGRKIIFTQNNPVTLNIQHKYSINAEEHGWKNTNQSSLLKNKNMSVSCSAKLKREDLIFRDNSYTAKKQLKTLWLFWLKSEFVKQYGPDFTNDANGTNVKIENDKLREIINTELTENYQRANKMKDTYDYIDVMNILYLKILYPFVLNFHTNDCYDYLTGTIIPAINSSVGKEMIELSRETYLKKYREAYSKDIDDDENYGDDEDDIVDYITDNISHSFSNEKRKYRVGDSSKKQKRSASTGASASKKTKDKSKELL